MLMEITSNRSCSTRRCLDRLATISSALQLLNTEPSRRVELFTRKVGWKGRRGENACISNQHCQARFQQLIADKGDLDSLGVKRADEQNGHDWFLLCRISQSS